MARQTKQDLVESIANETGLSKKDAGAALDAGLSSMLHIPTTEEQEQMKNGTYNRTVKETGYTSWKATGESKPGLSQSIPPRMGNEPG